jgi:hypothetical protein
MAALLLAPLLAACPAGVPPHPASPADGFTISGSVAGSGGASVTVRAVGAATWTAAVDGNGAFTLTGLPRGEYALSVLGPATRAFTPASRIVTLLDRDVTGQDFTGAAVNVLTGHATGPSGAARLTVAGPVTRVLQSDPGGYYRATGLPDGEYVVHAAAAGATFTPISAVVTLGGGAVVTQDFTGAAVGAPTHAISGGFIGVALPGVRLTLSGAASGVTLSDAAGRYLFEGLADGDYQVTPARAVGHLYRERQRAATVAGADVAGQDFEVWAPAPARFAYVMAQPFGTLSWVIYQYAVAASGAVAALPTPTAPGAGSTPPAPTPTPSRSTPSATTACSRHSIRRRWPAWAAPGSWRSIRPAAGSGSPPTAAPR